MEIADLSPEVREKIESCRFDRIIEKHEGPWRWSDWLQQTELLYLGGYWILLPVYAENLENVTLERAVVSTERNTLTLFLKDTTWIENSSEEV